MIRAGEVMHHVSESVRPEAAVSAVAEVMLRTGLAGVPVADEAGRVVGVVLLDDLVLRGSGPAHLMPEIPRESAYEVMERVGEESKAVAALTAADLMRTDIPPAGEDTPVAEIANCMADARCDVVPVVREGRLVGVVTKCDLLRSIEWPGSGDSEQ